MDLAVAAAAAELGVDPRRVRRLLASGALPGRKVGHSWVVPADAVHRRARANHRPGRPFSPLRAWAAVAELAGIRADWLNSSARGQVRAVLARRAEADADQWAALLRNLAQLQRIRARSAQIARLVASPEVCDAQFPAAMLGLVVPQQVPSVFVAAPAWPALAGRLLIRPDSDASGGEPAHVLLVPGPALDLLAAQPALRDAAAIALASADLEPRVRDAAASWLSAAANRLAQQRRSPREQDG